MYGLDVGPSYRERPCEEVAEIWLGAKVRLKHSTYRRYERELRNYVLPEWTDIQIGAIRRERIDAWGEETSKRYRRALLQEQWQEHSQAMKPLASAYIHHLVGETFGGIIRHEVAEGLLSRNPLQHVKLPRDESEQSNLPTLTYQKIEALAEVAAKLTELPGDAALVRLLA